LPVEWWVRQDDYKRWTVGLSRYSDWLQAEEP
jgi:hypothetical protein